jgi:hypothetical protein
MKQSPPCDIKGWNHGIMVLLKKILHDVSSRSELGNIIPTDGTDGRWLAGVQNASSIPELRVVKKALTLVVLLNQEFFTQTESVQVSILNSEPNRRVTN